MKRLAKALQDAGAGLLLGADASGPYTGAPGPSVHTELATLVQAGLTPYQALLTGTRNPAQYFGTLDSTGTVAVGKRADLLLLEHNPLEPARYEANGSGPWWPPTGSYGLQPVEVMLGGRRLPMAELEQRLAEVSAVR